MSRGGGGGFPTLRCEQCRATQRPDHAAVRWRGRAGPKTPALQAKRPARHRALVDRRVRVSPHRPPPRAQPPGRRSREYKPRKDAACESAIRPDSRGGRSTSGARAASSLAEARATCPLLVAAVRAAPVSPHHHSLRERSPSPALRGRRIGYQLPRAIASWRACSRALVDWGPAQPCATSPPGW